VLLVYFKGVLYSLESMWCNRKGKRFPPYKIYPLSESSRIDLAISDCLSVWKRWSWKL